MSTYRKYPKTFHIPTSLNLQNDDRRIDSMDAFQGQRVIVTVKADGENTNCYNDRVHARSIDSGDHVSRHWMKAFHASIKHDIPEGWRICGENCYALHSIYYNGLPSYFLAFGIYNEKNTCLSWDDTVEFCELLNIHTVPVIYDGVYDAEKIQEAYDDNFTLGGWTPKENVNDDFKSFRDLIIKGHDLNNFAEQVEEGYVIRIAESFNYDDFQKSCAKWVRKSHVRCSDHWMSEMVIPNRLKG